jgi:papain like cysteine protease AvrRpt2
MPQIPRRRRAFWPCLLCGVGVGALGMAPAGPPTAAQDRPPDRCSLPVKLHPQETEVWCWAANGQMTMEFLGKDVSQSEQANLAFRRSDCGQRPTPRPCVRGGEILLRPYGFRYDASTRPLSEQSVIHQLHTLRKPIPFAWRFPGGGGHAALVTGYVRQADGTLLVECLDPYPPPGKDARAWGGGQRIFMPYKRWVGDYDHTFGHAFTNVTRKP